MLLIQQPAPARQFDAPRGFGVLSVMKGWQLSQKDAGADFPRTESKTWWFNVRTECLPFNLIHNRLFFEER